MIHRKEYQILHLVKKARELRRLNRLMGGKVYHVQNLDEFDKWYDSVAYRHGAWKESEVKYLDNGGVYIRNDIYEGSDSLNRDNLTLFKRGEQIKIKFICK